MDSMNADYETDILLWSERQAELLRQHAAATKTNTGIDWQNVIEEVESVGNEQLHAVTSWLLQALVHTLKVHAWPLSRDVPHWQAEARLFRAQARRRYAPSMRRRMDLDDIYADALRALPDTMDDQPPLPVPGTCPLTLDDLLSRD
jgi:hypothetical protein